MHIKIYKMNAAAPRLSDEEPDLMEQEDSDSAHVSHVEGWLPWSQDDLIDIRRVIESKMPDKQREILEAFLLGNNAEDLGVTEKYWRYHFKKAIEFIKEELGL
jgi:hypothetical protein